LVLKRGHNSQKNRILDHWRCGEFAVKMVRRIIRRGGVGRKGGDGGKEDLRDAMIDSEPQNGGKMFCSGRNSRKEECERVVGRGEKANRGSFLGKEKKKVKRKGRAHEVAYTPREWKAAEK